MINELVPYERIESKIYLLRGQKAMLDIDLAELYGVLTKYLNKQIKRNIERFPEDFMFQLSALEWEKLRVQFGTAKYSMRRNLPYAFTEHGILMLSSVLNSQRAVEVNVQIMRTFIKLRKMFFGYKELKERLDRLEADYGEQFRSVFQAINSMLEESPTKPIGVGFKKEIET